MAHRNPLARPFFPNSSMNNNAVNCSDANQSLNMTALTNISSVSQQGTKRKAQDSGPRTSSKVRRTQSDRPKVIYFSFDTPVPSLKDFNLKLIALTNCQNYGELRKSKNGKGFSIKPKTTDIAKTITPSKVTTAFPNSKVRLSTMTTNNSKPSFVITNIDLDVQTDDIKTELQNQHIDAETVHRITSRATNNPTRLVRVFISSEANARTAVENGVSIFNQRKRCEKSRQEPQVIQCFKCLEFGHRSHECCNSLKFRRCGGEHLVKDCAQTEQETKCPNCGENHSSNYRGCAKYQEAKSISYAQAVKKSQPETSTAFTKIEKMLETMNERLSNIEDKLTQRVKTLEDQTAQLTIKTSSIENSQLNNFMTLAALIQCTLDSSQKKINIMQALNFITGQTISNSQFDGKVKEFKQYFASHKITSQHGR